MRRYASPLLRSFSLQTTSRCGWPNVGGNHQSSIQDQDLSPSNGRWRLTLRTCAGSIWNVIRQASVDS